MFYYKKTSEGFPDVDLSKVHATNEIHFMRENKLDLCANCKKKFKDDDALRLDACESITYAVHVECEKKEDKVVA